MHLQKSFFIVSCFLFLCLLSLNAQTDSLQGKSYEELIKLYESTLFKNPYNARTYAYAANKLAEKERNLQKLGWSTFHIAYANSFIPSYEEAMEGIEKSIIIAEKIDDNFLLFKNHNLKGNVLSETDKEFKALDEYKIAKKYADLTGDPLNKIVVAVNVAYIKKIHKDHKEAIKIYKENLNILDKLKTSNPKKDTYKKQILFNLSDCYLRIKKPTIANEYNDLALSICSDKEAPVLFNSLLMNKAIAHFQKKEYDSSMVIAKKVIAYFSSIHQEERLMIPYFYLGRNYFKKEKFKEAIRFLEKANDIIRKNKIAYSDQKDGYEILYESYNKLGDSIKAVKYLNIYLKLDKKADSINIDLNNKIHNEIDIVPLQEEIDSLGSYTNYLYGASILLLLVLIGFVVWFKLKQKQNKVRFQELLVTIELLEQDKKNTTPEVVVKEASSTVTDENALQILKNLAVFEEKELYLRQDCNLAYVAKKLKTNTTYLSNVINTYKEKSFKSYLSELRINAALIKLKNDEKLRSYTIKAIAEEFGFKRSETFSRAFKTQTNMYPSNYIKNIDNHIDT
ncbi:helix-turn-helix domain-containing protein [Kordia sp.]|uniref:helix-turn-helix domain-containing protein n=1 Tax=Kordia sp. TaxID=1965332 RepID=UPI0025C41BC8|nr:helix-turn-helix domain-containing protein [Kordia sp.]MCH2192725.1 helix-turn-helix domain-containing protein [Kordia sp.]